MAKYCVKCGKTLPDGVEICPDCNAAAAQEREAALFTHMTSDAEVWKAAEPVKQKPKREHKAFRNAWLYLAGVLLVAAAVILRAVTDYRGLGNRLQDTGSQVEKKHIEQKMRAISAFFFSEWYCVLSGQENGSEVIELLDQEVFGDD